MEIPRIEELNTTYKRSAHFIQKYFPEFYQYLMDNYTNLSSDKWNERLYQYYHGLTEPRKCLICGKPTLYMGFQRAGYDGYQDYCGIKCASGAPETREKMARANMKRFGVPFATMNPEIKQKAVDTTISRHGGMGSASKSIQKKIVENYKRKHNIEGDFESIFEIPEVHKKGQNTLITRYGENWRNRPEFLQKARETYNKRYPKGSDAQKQIIQKARATMKERYGVDHPTKYPEFIQKQYQGLQQSIIKKTPGLISIQNDWGWIMKCPHPECTKCQEKYYETDCRIQYDRVRGGTETCTRLLPIQDQHTSSTTLELWVRDILDSANIEYITNTKKFINPHELDVFIPGKNIAIECNGIFWHASNTDVNSKKTTFHINKFTKCQSINVDLLTIWEDWIKNKPEITKSLILSKLGVFETRIGARQCEVKHILPKYARSFFETNHIQGHSNCKIYLGLFYKDELVSVMGFGKKRSCMGNKKNSNSEWELVRFCSKLNWQIIGAASKLLKHFISEYNPTKITSFSCNDISVGNLYKQLGFSQKGISKAYWWIRRNTLERYHRSSFTKKKLAKMGWGDSSMTEVQIMTDKGFYQVYDSGTTKWELILR